MSRSVLRFAFDYVEPASYLVSYLVDEAFERVPEDARPELVHLPLEVRPPPLPLLDPADPAWRAHEDAMTEAARRAGIPLEPPALVPWSRKAHELGCHAREKGCFRPVHRSLFEARFVEGRDIGRVDVLVEIAHAAGLDRTETKAVLDVDRYADAVTEWRRDAERSRIPGVPTLLLESGEEGKRETRRLEGFRDRASLEDFLRDAVVPDVRS
jgi:predicted DsbA family dithiol-disulfide isomerase